MYRVSGMLMRLGIDTASQMRALSNVDTSYPYSGGRVV